MLSALILIPLVSAIIVGLLPVTGNNTRNITLIAAVSVLIINLAIAWQFDFRQESFQFVEDFAWIEWIGLNYHLGLDGLSFPLVLLNSFLTVIAILSTSTTIQRPKLWRRIYCCFSSFMN